MTIDHLNLKLLIFVDILQVLRFDFKKFKILEIWTFTHGNIKMRGAVAHWWDSRVASSRLAGGTVLCPWAGYMYFIFC